MKILPFSFVLACFLLTLTCRMGFAQSLEPVPADSLTESQIESLMINGYEPLQAKPGETLMLTVKARSETIIPPYPEEVKIMTRWSIQPESGIRLDKSSGKLSIGEDVHNGTEYSITAEVKTRKGWKTLDKHLYIYTSAENPFVGLWEDRNNNIGELWFRSDGTFSVTAHPFEVYKDYWGTYRYDLDKKSIVFEINGGNKIPEDKDLEGSFEILANGNLLLHDLSFGTLSEKAGRQNEYIFTQNAMKLPLRRRQKEFAALSDEEVLAIESDVAQAFSVQEK